MHEVIGHAEADRNSRIELGKLLNEGFFTVNDHFALCKMAKEYTTGYGLPFSRLFVELVLPNTAIH